MEKKKTIKPVMAIYEDETGSKYLNYMKRSSKRRGERIAKEGK